MTSPKKVRVRFAPSPTGPLHIGGVRTILYNYFFAKKHGGDFILRIEDTDQTRFVAESEPYIQKTLAWLGITPDESPWHGGPHGPYRQSERKSLYRAYALELIEKGHAYYAFDTPEEIAAMRERQEALGVVSPKYDAITRLTMTNALTLSAAEVSQRIASGAPYVVRMKINPKAKIRLKDEVRNWIQVEGHTLDDKVLFKSDGLPTYHLANIVDDHLMGITHVIRGEEWLPSTPLHVLLYEAFGWEKPAFVHLPLLLKSDGKGKLSKRSTDGTTLTLPMDWHDPLTQKTYRGFREKGYLPEAVINFLALMGWHPGGNQEIFTREELTAQFSVARIKRAGIRFDMHKAEWLNAEHLRRLPNEDLIKKYIAPPLQEAGCEVNAAQLDKVCQLAKDRAVFPQDLWPIAKPFFLRPQVYEKEFWKEESYSALAPLFAAWRDKLEALPHWEADAIQQALKSTLKAHQMKPGKVMPLLRLLLIGSSQGPHVVEILTLLGQQESLARIQSLPGL